MRPCQMWHRNVSLRQVASPDLASLAYMVSGSQVALLELYQCSREWPHLASQVASERGVARSCGVKEPRGVAGCGVKTWRQAPSPHAASRDVASIRGVWRPRPPGKCLQNVSSVVGRYVHPHKRPPCHITCFGVLAPWVAPQPQPSLYKNWKVLLTADCNSVASFYNMPTKGLVLVQGLRHCERNLVPQPASCVSMSDWWCIWRCIWNRPQEKKDVAYGHRQKSKLFKNIQCCFGLFERHQIHAATFYIRNLVCWTEPFLDLHFPLTALPYGSLLWAFPWTVPFSGRSGSLDLEALP